MNNSARETIEEITPTKTKNHIGSMVLKRGLFLYEISHDTLKVGKAEIGFDEKGKKFIITKEKHWYVPALNKGNAIRKYTKMMLKLLNDAKNKVK